MECKTVVELLGNYIDEELTSALHESVDHHIATCDSCRADLATLTNSIKALAEAPAIESPSPWFADRLLLRIAQETNTPLTGETVVEKDLQLGLW